MKPQSGSRINALDLLRGWCLVVISSDHLGLFPSVFDPLTGRGLLWVTAAEGFFFISGTLVGMVRGRSMHRHGLKVATHELWRRAGKLYLASIALTLLFTWLARWLGSEGFEGVKGGVAQYGSAWELLWNTLTLQYAYGWADFLNYYVVFLLVAPGALWLLRKRWWWVLLLISVTLWVGKTHFGTPLTTAFFTWQAYFFTGAIFGYHYDTVHDWYRRMSDMVRARWRGVVYGLTAVTVLASFAFTFGTPVFEHRNELLYQFFYAVKENWYFKMLFQDNRTGLLRLPMFLLWFSTAYLLVRRYESWIMRKIGWLLVPLGRNSLYVYILQGLVVFAISLLNVGGGFWANTLINISVIMIYWVAVRQRFLFSVIPR